MVSLPFDLIDEYVHKPKPIEEKEFARRKQLLLGYTLRLRKMGKEIENEKQYVALIKGYAGWKKRRAFNKKIRLFEARTLLSKRCLHLNLNS